MPATCRGPYDPACVVVLTMPVLTDRHYVTCRGANFRPGRCERCNEISLRLLSARVPLWLLWRSPPRLHLRRQRGRPLPEVAVNRGPDSARTQQKEVSSLRWRKRWGSVSSPRHDTAPISIALPPQRKPAGRSARASYQTPRARKLTPELETEIRRLAGGRSLRDLAAEFGVSHETIRSVIREHTGSAPSLHQQINTSTVAMRSDRVSHVTEFC